MSRNVIAVAASLVVVLFGLGSARAQTESEKKRQQLLDELGLKPARKPPAPPPPAAEPEVPEPAAAPSVPGKPAEPAPPPSFRTVHASLVASCAGCHVEGGPAGGTRFKLLSDLGRDFTTVRALVTPGKPAQSALLTKAAGQMHGGGALWPPSSRPYRRASEWILAGATGPGAASVVAAEPSAARTKPPGPRPPQPEPTPAPPAIVEAPPPPTPEKPAAPSATASDATPAVMKLLGARCSPCHNANGPAAASRLLLVGEPAADERTALAFATPALPDESPLLTKATGQSHGGGELMAVTDVEYQLVRRWIASHVVSATVDAPAATTAPATSAPPPPPPQPSPPPPPIAGHPGAHPGLIALPGGLSLNGRFDLNFERRALADTPWSSGDQALRSYHHFLFLSRQTADDPFGFTAELTSLQFWQLSYRFAPKTVPLRILAKAGKLIVPFGADPLFHQAYGGLVGFDQRVLPAIWAQEGAATELTWQAGRTVVTSDLYAVRGFRLRSADAILNLQNDFSPDDKVRPGIGHRLGLAWNALSGWYSLYINPLGAGRVLTMQAVDITLARMREIPVLGSFSLAVGFLRADVSGGGSGLDYYHFADYLQVRYHPTNWLYLQYRGGVRTFNNRRGVWIDDTRLTALDGSTHSLAVAARCHGLLGSIGYTWNLEKADEVRDDFFRTTVAYEF